MVQGNLILSSRPIWLSTVRCSLMSYPFNIMVVQIYALTSDYDDEHFEDIYANPQGVIDMAIKRTF